MKKTKIIVDSASDMTTEMCQQLDIHMLPLSISFNGKEYFDSVDLSPDEFVELLRTTGQVPKTSMVSPGCIMDAFQQYINEYDEILYITISSEISGTYSAAAIQAEEINKTSDGGFVTVYDSKTFSIGQAMLAKIANEMARAGDCVTSIVERISEIRKRQRCIFSLSDLNFVRLGGRVSAAQAFIGGLLDIKPLLQIDQNGCPVIFSKARGINKTIIQMVENLSKEVAGRLEDVWYIHCDAAGMIERLETAVSERFEPVMSYICKARGCIGTHGGPGLFGLAYLVNK